MTAVKEQFMQMLPGGLTDVPDDEVQYMINILVKWKKPKGEQEKPFRRQLGVLKNKDFYMAPDFDTCIDNDPASKEQLSRQDHRITLDEGSRRPV